MRLEHEFFVPVPPDQAWTALLDVERIAPCMPGAILDTVEGDDFSGRVEVKVGPMQVTLCRQRPDWLRKTTMCATGRYRGERSEARGHGTAAMTVTAQLYESGEGTRVTAHSDLSATGRPAQFGRGVLADVGAKIIGQFAECLTAELAAPPVSRLVPEEAAAIGDAQATLTSQDRDEGLAPTAQSPDAGGDQPARDRRRAAAQTHRAGRRLDLAAHRDRHCREGTTPISALGHR